MKNKRWKMGKESLRRERERDNQKEEDESENVFKEKQKHGKRMRGGKRGEKEWK